MLTVLIGFIFLCIIVGVIWWAIQQLLPLLPIAEPFATILRVLMVLVLVVIVLYAIMMLLSAAGIHVALPRM